MASLKQIGAQITVRRKKLGITQDELAGLAEIDRSFLSEIENGHKNPSITTLVKIAEALDTKVSALLEESND